MRRVIRIASAALVAWAVLGAMPSSVQGQKMIIGQGFLNTNALPLWIALDQGYFKKHGVEVELTFIRGGGRGIPGPLSREGGGVPEAGTPGGGAATHATPPRRGPT